MLLAMNPLLFREEQHVGEGVKWRSSIPMVGYKTKKESRNDSPFCMQSVGESNPCYQDENLAS